MEPKEAIIIVEEDLHVRYYNGPPTNNPRGEWTQSPHVRQARGPDGGYADYYFRNFNDNEQAERVLLMRRRDADYMPIDRGWLDISYILPLNILALLHSEWAELNAWNHESLVGSGGQSPPNLA
ncbi:MAG: hypothetical protein HY904_18200 [Deltaproteobacteria bacterium]|nr:hypothetical protein [Deltaproteobacteria bacterium]